MNDWDNLYPTVAACATLLLGGVVLHAETDEGVVTAGNGKVIDWREVKSGEVMADDLDAFDVAWLLVGIVGPAAAGRAVESWKKRTGAEDSIEAPRPRVTAFAVNPCGGRRRTFKVGRFTVMVEPHEDDEDQAKFTERLAAAAAKLEEKGA